VREVIASGHVLQRNPGWVQMLADVLERPVALSAVDEASARGAAVLTLERLGHVAGDAPLGDVFLPREERSEALRSAHQRQRELYRRLFSS
jgi:gluconokinase